MQIRQRPPQDEDIYESFIARLSLVVVCSKRVQADEEIIQQNLNALLKILPIASMTRERETGKQTHRRRHACSETSRPTETDPQLCPCIFGPHLMAT